MNKGAESVQFLLYMYLVYNSLELVLICKSIIIHNSFQGPSWPRILGRSDFSLQEN